MSFSLKKSTLSTGGQCFYNDFYFVKAFPYVAAAGVVVEATTLEDYFQIRDSIQQGYQNRKQEAKG